MNDSNDIDFPERIDLNDKQGAQLSVISHWKQLFWSDLSVKLLQYKVTVNTLLCILLNSFSANGF